MSKISIPPIQDLKGVRLIAVSKTQFEGKTPNEVDVVVSDGVEYELIKDKATGLCNYFHWDRKVDPVFPSFLFQLSAPSINKSVIEAHGITNVYFLIVKEIKE